MSLTILFTRHGQTIDNEQMRLSTAPPGPPLNDKGRGQAAELRAALAGVALDAIYTSPIVRARETADVVAQGRGIPVYEEERFRELFVGEREGRTDPGVFDEMDQVWRAWTREGRLDTLAGPAGESGSAVLARGVAAIEAIRLKHGSGTLLVVAHSGIMQLLVPHLCENLPASYGVDNWCRNCELIELDVTGERIRCTRWAGKVPLV